MFSLDKSMTGQPASTIHRLGNCWKGSLTVAGAAEVTVESAVATLTDSLATTIGKLWDAKLAKDAKSPIDPGTLAKIHAADAKIELCCQARAAAQQQEVDLIQQKNEALCGGADNGPAMLKRLTDIEARIRDNREAMARLDTEHAEAVRTKPALIQRWAADRDEVLRVAIDKETRQAAEAEAAAWKALEAAMSPILDQIAVARAKLMALQTTHQGNVVERAVKARLEALLAPAAAQPAPARAAG